MGTTIGATINDSSSALSPISVEERLDILTTLIMEMIYEDQPENDSSQDWV